jgi:hypothetical protein
LITAAMGASRLTGVRRGAFLRSEAGCDDAFGGFGTCPAGKEVVVNHYARKEMDGLALSPLVSADFFLTRHFAVGGLFQAILSRDHTLYALSLVVRLGE